MRDFRVRARRRQKQRNQRKRCMYSHTFDIISQFKCAKVEWTKVKAHGSVRRNSHTSTRARTAEAFSFECRCGNSSDVTWLHVHYASRTLSLVRTANAHNENPLLFLRRRLIVQWTSIPFLFFWSRCCRCCFECKRHRCEWVFAVTTILLWIDKWSARSQQREKYKSKCKIKPVIISKTTFKRETSLFCA